MKCALSLFLLLSFPVLANAQGIGSITVADGAVRLVRGTVVSRVAEGMQIHRGDFLETPERGFLQMEFAGGKIVAAGPSTRLYLSGRAGSEQVILLSGWMKCENNSSAGVYRLVAPLLAASTGTGNGAVLMHAVPGATEVFLESGSFVVNEVGSDGGFGRIVETKTGQFLVRQAGKKPAETSTRPSRAFLDSMPVPFRDTLPSRAARFASKGKVEPKVDHEASYADVQPWLTMSRAWRRGFTERFKPRLKDAEFRKALAAHLEEYPEWGPILYPERYEKNEKSGPASSPSSEHPRN